MYVFDRLTGACGLVRTGERRNFHNFCPVIFRCIYTMKLIARLKDINIGFGIILTKRMAISLRYHSAFDKLHV